MLLHNINLITFHQVAYSTHEQSLVIEKYLMHIIVVRFHSGDSINSEFQLTHTWHFVPKERKLELSADDIFCPKVIVIPLARFALCYRGMVENLCAIHAFNHFILLKELDLNFWKRSLRC